MKNKKVIFMLIFIFIIILIGGIMIINKNKLYRTELGNSEKEILVEKAYRNHAWGFQYRGKAIFNDGSIYEWEINEPHYRYEEDSIDEHVKWILDNGICINKKVTERNLEKIEENINILEDDIKVEGYGADMGSNYIVVWNTNKKKIKLKESGDNIGENKSVEAQKLIKIIDKYLK